MSGKPDPEPGRHTGYRDVITVFRRLRDWPTGERTDYLGPCEACVRLVSEHGPQSTWRAGYPRSQDRDPTIN